MINFIPENLAKQIFDALPEDIKNTKKDLQNDLKAILSSTLAKFNLVTREEFDIQTKVLQATRLRVEALEKHIQSQHNKEKTNCKP